MLIVAIFIIGLMMLTQDVSSFAATSHHHHRSLLRYRNSLHAATPKVVEEHSSWSPQDLTANNPGFLPIPGDDYIKKYQSNSELWPVEFFVIAYRRFKNEIQILVRRSANGTSKYGLGTGVPATRWIPSTSTKAPDGYKFTEPAVTFDACNYPEFPKGIEEYWSYQKIDMKEDAFTGLKNDLQDVDLEKYATKVRYELQAQLSMMLMKQNGGDELSDWQRRTISTVKKIVDSPKSVAAIQGTLRMSGLFAKKEANSDERNISFGSAPNPTQLASSVRAYTMFPQMPDPMPLPSTSAEDLQKEIATRQDGMVETGRDPHKDKYGRVYTHISTNNVSNTIHGIYFTIDTTNLLSLDDDEIPPALDLFGTKPIDREWVSLTDLKVMKEDRKMIDKVDTKPTFISGFIVRQLLKEGVIKV